MSLKNLCNLSKLRRAVFILLSAFAISSLFYYLTYEKTSIGRVIVSKVKRTNKASAGMVFSHWINSTVRQSNGHSTTTKNAFNVVSFNASTEAVSNHQCVRLSTPGQPSKICVHPIKSDVWVSGSLIKSGIWEGHLVHLVANAINKHPSMILLDLGCNIGTFTVYVCSLKRKVVAVDASQENIQLLSRSVVMNHFEDRVTLIWNALSDVHGNVVLGGYPENKGGTYVKPTNKTDSTVVVKTTTLDDLIPLFKDGTSVYIKMDVETYEWRVLNGGHKFFKAVDVGYVVMEFSSHRKVDSGKKICDFMSGFGFRPYDADRNVNQLLNMTQYDKWPNNVLWSKH